jgi:hypothetical protein
MPTVNKAGLNTTVAAGVLSDGTNFFRQEGAGVQVDGGAGTLDQGTVGLYKIIQVTSAEILALHATPKTLIAAPGAGKVIFPRSVLFFLDYNSAAYSGIAAGEDWTIRYTDASGATVATLETTGFLDATADALRWLLPTTTAAITPVANSPIVLHQSTGEVTTGNSPVYVRIDYDILPSTLA